METGSGDHGTLKEADELVGEVSAALKEKVTSAITLDDRQSYKVGTTGRAQLARHFNHEANGGHRDDRSGRPLPGAA